MTAPEIAPRALDAGALGGLRARHLAFLEARLVSPRAEAEWGEHLAAVCESLLAARVRDLADVDAIAGAVQAVFTSEAVERAARPVAKRVVTLALAELRAEAGTPGERMSPAARATLDELLGLRGLIPDRFLREFAREDAIEEVLRDVLYDAFKEFLEKVNPFFADWGLPSLLKKLGPFGMGKSFDAMRVEFDKRLDPEIRKFLHGFSRKALRGIVEGVITGADEPRFIAVRKHLAEWVLAQPIAELARGVDDRAVALVQELSLQVAAQELPSDATDARVRRLLNDALGPRMDHTVREVLGELGVTLSLDVTAFAKATWPVVRTVVGSEPVRAWLANVVGEFYGAELASAAAP